MSRDSHVILKKIKSLQQRYFTKEKDHDKLSGNNKLMSDQKDIIIERNTIVKISINEVQGKLSRSEIGTFHVLSKYEKY